MSARELIDEPKAGVMPRARVLRPGITETDDELEWIRCHIVHCAHGTDGD
jgi:hypothetical protein